KDLAGGVPAEGDGVVQGVAEDDQGAGAWKERGGDGRGQAFGQRLDVRDEVAAPGPRTPRARPSGETTGRVVQKRAQHGRSSSCGSLSGPAKTGRGRVHKVYPRWGGNRPKDFPGRPSLCGG